MSVDEYPGPVALRSFLHAYPKNDDYLVSCDSPDLDLDGPLVDEGRGQILVNFRGLAIVTYQSVVTYESALFGSPFRGYLVMFRYTLRNGPLHWLPRVFLGSEVYHYTSSHMVITYMIIEFLLTF